MSGNPSMGTSYAAGVAPELICANCQTPLRTDFYRAFNRFLCPNCAVRMRRAGAAAAPDPARLLTAGVAGLAAGLGAAAVWALIVQSTHLEVGIVASLIGYAVGKAACAASGNQRGPALQWLAAVLSVFSILCGKVMVLAWQVVDLLNGRHHVVNAPVVARVVKAVLVNQPAAVFHAFDLLWIALAIYAAWRLCKAPPVAITGPFRIAPPGAGA